MTTSGDETTRLRRVILVLAIVLALIVGVGAGVGITVWAANGGQPQPTVTPSVVASLTPTPTVTPTLTPTPSATAQVSASGSGSSGSGSSAAGAAKPAAVCPAGGLKVALNGAIASNTNGVIKVLAGYLLTNTSDKYAITVAQGSLVKLATVDASGAQKAVVQAFSGSDLTVNFGQMKMLGLTHDGYSLQSWQASTALKVADSFKNLSVKWVGSGCKVPISVSSTTRDLPVVR